MDPSFGNDLASYSITPGRRTSYPNRLPVDPTLSPTSGGFVATPEEQGESESDEDRPAVIFSAAGTHSMPLTPVEELGSIQFKTIARRADPQVRTIYGQPINLPSPTRAGTFAGKLGLTQPNPEDQRVQTAVNTRKQSLVRAEEYMPPMPRVGSNFNPYMSPSWARKPSDNLDLDLEGDLGDDADDSSFRQGRFESVALPNASVINVAFERSVFDDADSIDVKEVDEPRTLGGKRLVKSVDWRKKLSLDPHARSKSEQPAVAPVFHLNFSNTNLEKGTVNEKQSAVHFAKQAYAPAIVQVNGGKPRGHSFMWLAPFTALFTQGLIIAYLFLRVKYLLSVASHSRVNVAAGWLFFGVELTYATYTGFSSLWAVFTRTPVDAKVLRIKGDAWLPTVDVLVVCTGQHDQLVMDSAIAAAKLDWPVDKLRVLIIDDSSSHELQRRAESYANSRALHLTYHRRSTRPQAAGAAPTSKSALINFGLTETRLHGRTPADYVLVLDADCIADGDMLRALVPYMIQNQRLGLVRCSQVFYNLPCPLSSTLGTFINTVEPLEDARSGFLLRRSAVEDIGGFPTNSSVEDGQLAALMVGKGYETTFVRETLQHGLVPDSFVLHLRQRLARRLASLRTAGRLGFFVAGGLRLRQMGFVRRLGALFTSLSPLSSIAIFASLVMIPVSLFLNQFLIPVASIAQLNMLIRLLFAIVMAERLHELVFCLPSGTPGASHLMTRSNFMAPYATLSMMRGLFFGVPAIHALYPAEDAERERATQMNRRISLFRRIGSIVFGFAGTLLHVVLAVSVIASLGFVLGKTLQPFADGLRTGRQTGLICLLTVAWPSAVLLWFSLLKGAVVPIAYALFPPSVPARDRLLSWSLLGSVIVTLYVTVLFALTFDETLNI